MSAYPINQSINRLIIHSGMCLVILDEVNGALPGDLVDVGDLVADPNAVELLRMFKQFGSECGLEKERRLVFPYKPDFSSP
jgi:hypothetical protein